MRNTRQLRAMLAADQPRENLREVLLGILDLLDRTSCTDHDDCMPDPELAAGCALRRAREAPPVIDVPREPPPEPARWHRDGAGDSWSWVCAPAEGWRLRVWPPGMWRVTGPGVEPHERRSASVADARADAVGFVEGLLHRRLDVELVPPPRVTPWREHGFRQRWRATATVEGAEYVLDAEDGGRWSVGSFSGIGRSRAGQIDAGAGGGGAAARAAAHRALEELTGMHVAIPPSREGVLQAPPDDEWAHNPRRR